MSGDPFFLLGAARTASLFCGAKIHPDCLHIGADGSVRVSLSATAESWFHTLSQLGEVLHLTRNSVAVLGTIRAIPELIDWSNSALPRDAARLLTPNLGQYASLWAVRETSPAGPVYGLEAGDVSGRRFQKVVLTARSRRELFEQFVIRHQSPLAETEHWISPNHHASQHRCQAISQRLAYLRLQQQEGATTIHALSSAGLPQLLAAAAAARVPVRTTHYNHALNCAAVWLPEPPTLADRESDGVTFFHGANVGLHVLTATPEMWLWQRHCRCCDRENWTIEIGGPDDQIGLAITVGDERLESKWRALVAATLLRSPA
ncbi:MAG: hemin-degrading factor [Verrucomicrobiae bacterium]|nr:hemin-degrading factor [Verrucomicrobiae bacterium]